MGREPEVADGGIPRPGYHAERRDKKLVDGAEREVEKEGGEGGDDQGGRGAGEMRKGGHRVLRVDGPVSR